MILPQRMLSTNSTLTRLCAAAYGCVRFQSTAQSAQPKDVFDSAKPFTDIPFKTGYPVVNNIFEFIRRPGKAHEITYERHQQLGPIYREKTGVFDIVFITDADAIGDFLRQEGKYPKRPEMPVWKKYREISGEADGILTAIGPEWHRMRSVVDKPLLKIKSVETYADEFNVVIGEFLDRLARIRNSEGTVEKIDVEMFNWSLESICTLLYNRRLGCLNDEKNPNTAEFVKAITQMFATTVDVGFLPPSIAKVVRPFRYKAHMKASDTLFRVARQYINEAVEKLHLKHNEDEVGLLEYLLNQERLTKSEVYSNVTELMTGAVETTSNTMQFMMYEIAENPEVQAKLFEELKREVSEDTLPTHHHLKNMPYLKAVIKETLRLYPVGSNLGRDVQEDVVVMGYQVPKGKSVVISLYVTGRLPSLYKDPLTFRPERWLRESRSPTDKPNPFSYLPFGFGPRMCIGRRVAELEMQLLLTQMLRRFKLESANAGPPDVVQYVLTQPKEAIRVRLVDRKSD